MRQAILYIFAGLPGTGKTTLSRLIAARVGAAHLRIDTIEQRSATVPGLRLPTWRDVEMREYHDWTSGRIVIDTAGKSAAECFETLLKKLSAMEA